MKTKNQLNANLVSPILERMKWRLPKNVEISELSRWHHGPYYGYGKRGLWVPLNSTGGIATKVFHDHNVKFPKHIERELIKLLEPA